MSYTLLALVDQVAGELGLAQPSTVIGSNVNQTVQWLALAQRLGKDLVREFPWNRNTLIYVLTTTAAVTVTGNTTSGSAIITGMSATGSLAATYVCTTGTGIPTYAEITSVDSATQVTMNLPATAAGTGVSLTFAKQDYALPSDYNRILGDTDWDRTNHWPNPGAKTSQEWAAIQGSGIAIAPRNRFRIYNNNLRLVPAPTTATNMSFEYVSNYWVIATGGTAATKATFTVDTDTCIYPDDLMMAGLKYYFLKAKKLDFGPELAEFN